MMFLYKRGGNDSHDVLTILIMSVHNSRDVDLSQVCYLKKATWLVVEKIIFIGLFVSFLCYNVLAGIKLLTFWSEELP